MNVYQATVDNYGYGECTELLIVAESEEACWDFLVKSDYRIEDSWDITRIRDVEYTGDATETTIIRHLH